MLAQGAEPPGTPRRHEAPDPAQWPSATFAVASVAVLAQGAEPPGTPTHPVQLRDQLPVTFGAGPGGQRCSAAFGHLRHCPQYWPRGPSPLEPPRTWYRHVFDSFPVTTGTGVRGREPILSVRRLPFGGFAGGRSISPGGTRRLALLAAAWHRRQARSASPGGDPRNPPIPGIPGAADPARACSAASPVVRSIGLGDDPRNSPIPGTPRGGRIAAGYWVPVPTRHLCCRSAASACSVWRWPGSGVRHAEHATAT